MYKLLDLFCGAGGLSFGFEESKEFHITLASDIMPDAISTYQSNYPNTNTLCCDICELSKSILKKYDSDSVDLILGGPPCQSFSTSGKRLLDDPRGKLFQEYLRLIKLIKPKVFIFENVIGLLSMDKGKIFNTIISSFKDEGYNVTYRVLNAVDFGIPQNRKRVIIVGHTSEDFNFPRRTHLNNHLSLLDAIGDLPHLNNHSYNKYICEPQNYFQRYARIGSNELKYHDIPNHGESLLKVIMAIPEGGSASDLPDEIKPKSGFKNSYSRLWWNKPSSTITRNFGAPSSARCIHPVADRALTTREGARIQSFPDRYIFCGSRTSKNLQIGNAVPPILSKRLVKSVINCLRNRK